MPTVTGHTNAIRAGKAIGTNVYDVAGKKIGEVKDIVLRKNFQQHLVRRRRLRRRARHGREIPPRALERARLRSASRRVRRLVHAEQLKNAPADSLEALTKGDGLAFRDRAFTHYGTKPYWH